MHPALASGLAPCPSIQMLRISLTSDAFFAALVKADAIFTSQVKADASQDAILRF